MHSRCINISTRAIVIAGTSAVSVATVCGLGLLNMRPTQGNITTVPLFAITAIPSISTEVCFNLLLLLRFRPPQNLLQFIALGLAFVFALFSTTPNYIGVESVTETLGIKAFAEKIPLLAQALQLVSTGYYAITCLTTTVNNYYVLKLLFSSLRDFLEVFGLGSGAKQRMVNTAGHLLNLTASIANWIVLTQLIVGYYNNPRNEADALTNNIAAPLKQHFVLTAALVIAAFLIPFYFCAVNQKLLIILHEDLMRSRSAKAWLFAIGSHVWNLFACIYIAIIAAQGNSPFPLIALAYLAPSIGKLEASIKMFNAFIAISQGHLKLATEVVTDTGDLTNYAYRLHLENLGQEVRNGMIITRRLHRTDRLPTQLTHDSAATGASAPAVELDSLADGHVEHDDGIERDEPQTSVRTTSARATTAVDPVPEPSQTFQIVKVVTSAGESTRRIPIIPPATPRTPPPTIHANPLFARTPRVAASHEAKEHTP